MSEKKIDIPKLMRNNELFQAFVAESIEPIWCFEFDEPISVDLPEDEQFSLFFSRGYLVEKNRAYTQGTGYPCGTGPL